MVTPVEAATDGVVFVLVEVEVISGASGLRAEVTSVASWRFATLVEGRALKGVQEKPKSYLAGKKESKQVRRMWLRS